MPKQDGRKISRETLEYLRMRAIILWKKDREPQDIADDFGVGKSAVYNWINTYKRKGKQGLKRTIAPGASPKLSRSQRKRLVKLLGRSADTYQFDNPLWTCRRIQLLILHEFGKRLDISSVWRLLRDMGLTAQKPQRSAKEKNEQEVQHWIENEWPKIQAHAKRWQAMIYFLDESCVQLTAMLGTTWAKKGETPTVKVTGKRGSIMITSAITQAGRMVFRLEKKRITNKEHIEFLKQLQRNHPKRKIIVAEDQAPPHVAKEVKEFAKGNKKRFALYYLPSYSPELNPDEHVWSYLKGVKLKAHQAKSMDEFEPLVRSQLRSIQRSSSLISSFFYGPLFH